jgi:hypothetical protein
MRPVARRPPGTEHPDGTPGFFEIVAVNPSNPAYMIAAPSARRLGEAEQYLGEFVGSIADHQVGCVDREVPPTFRRLGVIGCCPPRLAAWRVTTVGGGLDVTQTEVALLDRY